MQWKFTGGALGYTKEATTTVGEGAGRLGDGARTSQKVTNIPPSKTNDLDSHFAFGKNWSSYAKVIGEREIEESKKGLLKLIPA